MDLATVTIFAIAILLVAILAWRVWGPDREP
jgi:hypothetical protein